MKILGDRALVTLLEWSLLFFCGGTWFVALAFVVIPFFGLENTSFNFPVDIRHGLVDERDGPGGTWTLRTAVAQVSTPHSRAWIGSLVAVPFMVLIAFVLGELRAIFGSLREGSPFVAKNARRLRRVGLAVLLFEGMRVVVTLTVIGPAIEKLRPLSGGTVLRASAWPSFTVLFLGLAVLALAEVFRRGTQMQDEQALTV